MGGGNSCSFNLSYYPDKSQKANATDSTKKLTGNSCYRVQN